MSALLFSNGKVQQRRRQEDRIARITVMPAALLKRFVRDFCFICFFIR